MPKPSTVPLWATAPAVPNVEPLLAEKQAGWPVGYKPPAQWFNWWQELVYLWCVWLRDFESTAHTWTALQTFDSMSVETLGVTGNFSQGSGVGDNVYFLGGANNWFCEQLAEFNGTVSFGAAVDFDIGSSVTFHDIATFLDTVSFQDNTTFTAPITFDGATGDNISTLALTTAPAGRFRSHTAASSEAARASIQATSPTTARALRLYKEGANLDTPDVAYTGVLEEVYGKSQLRGPNPLATDGNSNMVTPLSQLKAFVHFKLDLISTITINDGANILVSACTYNSATKKTYIYFATNFYNSYYAWTWHVETSPTVSPASICVVVLTKGNAAMELLFTNDVGVTLTDAELAGCEFVMTFAGRQAQV